MFETGNRESLSSDQLPHFPIDIPSIEKLVILYSDWYEVVLHLNMLHLSVNNPTPCQSDHALTIKIESWVLAGYSLFNQQARKP